MANKTFTEFQSDLTFNLGNRENISAYVDDWVNAAYIDFCTRDKFWEIRLPKNFLFHELQTNTSSDTSDGVAYVSVPSDCVSIYTIWDSTSDKKLNAINMRQYIKKTGRSDANSEGEPSLWVRYGSNIYFYPTPDTTYSMTIYYRKIPTELTGSGVTIIGAEWDEAILKLATTQSMLRLRMYEDFAIWKTEWIEMMASKIGIYEAEYLDKEDILKPDYSYLYHGRKT